MYEIVKEDKGLKEKENLSEMHQSFIERSERLLEIFH